jgi:hypothetical protein
MTVIVIVVVDTGDWVDAMERDESQMKDCWLLERIPMRSA